jgi:hypothetical protein
METSKLMKITGYVMIGMFAAFNLLTLVLMGNMKVDFGPAVAGPYSIFASKGFFIAYHVWGIILPLMCMYALWKEIRILFMTTLLLLLLLMFYPYFTSSPADQAQGKAIQEQRDSTARH